MACRKRVRSCLIIKPTKRQIQEIRSSQRKILAMKPLPRLVWAGTRIALVAGAVKLSLDNDVWSTTTKAGSNTYEKLKKEIVPGTFVYHEQLPSKEEVCSNAASCWNDNVNKTFDYINSVPSRIVEGIRSIKPANERVPVKSS
ncbi:protein QIL1 domain-containing protein [Ditylenchus destructor]|uniref:MICOS complex subunit MIC13 n=1 Tax=Ditylenchus destructor TaxID=166010 RepID=A0AAD4N9Z9_9BILA|nr:protein QIL1 domain-containing protein [Ditylenchus destructor]